MYTFSSDLSSRFKICSLSFLFSQSQVSSIRFLGAESYSLPLLRLSWFSLLGLHQCKVTYAGRNVRDQIGESIVSVIGKSKHPELKMNLNRQTDNIQRIHLVCIFILYRAIYSFFTDSSIKTKT